MRLLRRPLIPTSSLFIRTDYLSSIGSAGELCLYEIDGERGMMNSPRTVLASLTSSSIGVTDRFSPTSPWYKQGALRVMSYRHHRTVRVSGATRFELASPSLAGVALFPSELRPRNEHGVC